MNASLDKRRGVTAHLVLAVAAFLASGCAHTLEVKNLELYKAEFINSQSTGATVGLISVASQPEEERLVIATANALKRDGFKLTHPFFPNDENKALVDFIVKLTTSSNYQGSGWNFLINWPGFLLWTPAWHGYDYRAIYNFDADITDMKHNRTLPRLSIPIDLDIRHAAINRTWTEVSWFEWSAIAFIGGIVFTRYDKSVTPLLLDATETHIGDYVSSKIASTLIAAQGIEAKH